MKAIDKFKSFSRLAQWYKIKLKVFLINLNDFILRRPIIGDTPVVISLTTHGSRIETVHTSIQSIAAGCIRPKRFILWLNGNESQPLPTKLKYLQKRGLEIRFTQNLGPHTKYYPYVESIDNHELPLVTADDDVIYPKDWLLRLYDAHRSEPDIIHCHWAMRITLHDEKITPYLQWQKVVRSREASFLNFALGVQGVIYPPSFLNCLHTAGKAFQDTCPKADDIWLHVIALRNGFKVKTTSENHTYFDLVPHTQNNALWASNMLPDGNDAQISKTYSADDIRSLHVYAQQAHPS